MHMLKSKLVHWVSNFRCRR